MKIQNVFQKQAQLLYHSKDPLINLCMWLEVLKVYENRSLTTFFSREMLFCFNRNPSNCLFFFIYTERMDSSAKNEPFCSEQRIVTLQRRPLSMPWRYRTVTSVQRRRYLIVKTHSPGVTVPISKSQEEGLISEKR